MTPGGRDWRLTPQAAESLVEIALWTLEHFGDRQAARYEDELIARCQSIADGHAPSRDCSVLLGDAAPSRLSYARAGEHFVIFTEIGDEVVIVDFLHGRVDLPARIAALAAMRSL